MPEGLNTDSTMAQICCVVERITYQNPENGYSVFRVKVKGYDDLVNLCSGLQDGRPRSPEVLFLACRPDAMSRRLFSCYRHYSGNLTSENIDPTLSKAYSIRKANS